jgi:hypothetical protein
MSEKLKYWLIAKWRQWTHHDLKGDLQMDERAAWQDVLDEWRLLWTKR